MKRINDKKISVQAGLTDLLDINQLCMRQKPRYVISMGSHHRQGTILVLDEKLDRFVRAKFFRQKANQSSFLSGTSTAT